MGVEMPDDKHNTGPRDGQPISLTEDYEVRYWTKALGVSKDELCRAHQAGARGDVLGRHHASFLEATRNGAGVVPLAPFSRASSERLCNVAVDYYRPRDFDSDARTRMVPLGERG